MSDYTQVSQLQAIQAAAAAAARAVYQHEAGSRLGLTPEQVEKLSAAWFPMPPDKQDG